MEHWYENGFEDGMIYEDNKGSVYSSEDLSELTPWELEEMELHVFEV